MIPENLIRGSYTASDNNYESLKEKFVQLSNLKIKLPNGKVTDFHGDKTYIINASLDSGLFIDSDTTYSADDITIKLDETDNNKFSVWNIRSRLAAGNGITLSENNGITRIDSVVFAVDNLTLGINTETNIIYIKAATTGNGILKTVGGVVTWGSEYNTHLYANNNATNGSVKLTVYDDDIPRLSVIIKGTGSSTVTTDSNGVITINSIGNYYDGDGTTIKLNTSNNQFSIIPAGIGEDKILRSVGGVVQWDDNKNWKIDYINSSTTAEVGHKYICQKLTGLTLTLPSTNIKEDDRISVFVLNLNNVSLVKIRSNKDILIGLTNISSSETLDIPAPFIYVLFAYKNNIWHVILMSVPNTGRDIQADNTTIIDNEDTFSLFHGTEGQILKTVKNSSNELVPQWEDFNEDTRDWVIEYIDVNNAQITAEPNHKYVNQAVQGFDLTLPTNAKDDDRISLFILNMATNGRVRVQSDTVIYIGADSVVSLANLTNSDPDDDWFDFSRPLMYIEFAFKKEGNEVGTWHAIDISTVSTDKDTKYDLGLGNGDGGYTYLALAEDNNWKRQYRIIGNGSVSVSTDNVGLVISGTDTTYLADGVTLTGYVEDNKNKFKIKPYVGLNYTTVSKLLLSQAGEVSWGDLDLSHFSTSDTKYNLYSLADAANGQAKLVLQEILLNSTTNKNTYTITGAGTVSVTTDGSGNFTITGTDTNTDHNTQYKLVVDKSKTTNGDVYIRLQSSTDGTTYTDQNTFNVKGATNITVTTDSNGNITITGPDLTNLPYLTSHLTASIHTTSGSTNGNVQITLKETDGTNTWNRSDIIKLSGAGNTEVTTDLNGNIIVSGQGTNYFADEEIIHLDTNTKTFSIKPTNVDGKVLKTVWKEIDSTTVPPTSSYVVLWSEDQKGIDGNDYYSGRFIEVDGTNHVNLQVCGDEKLIHLSGNNDNSSGVIQFIVGGNDGQLLSTTNVGTAQDPVLSAGWVNNPGYITSYKNATYSCNDTSLLFPTTQDENGDNNVTVNHLWLSTANPSAVITSVVTSYLNSLTHDSTNDTLKIDPTNNTISWGEDKSGTGGDGDHGFRYNCTDNSITFPNSVTTSNFKTNTFSDNNINVNPSWISGVDTTNGVSGGFKTIALGIICSLISTDTTCSLLFSADINSNNSKITGYTMAVNPSWLSGGADFSNGGSNISGGYVPIYNVITSVFAQAPVVGGSDYGLSSQSILFNANRKSNNLISSYQLAVNPDWLSGATNEQSGFNAVTNAVNKFISGLFNANPDPNSVTLKWDSNNSSIVLSTDSNSETDLYVNKLSTSTANDSCLTSESKFIILRSGGVNKTPIRLSGTNINISNNYANNLNTITISGMTNSNSTYGYVDNGGLTSSARSNSDGGCNFAVDTAWLATQIGNYLTNNNYPTEDTNSLYGYVNNGGLSSQTGSHTDDGGCDFAVDTTWLNNKIENYLTTIIPNYGEGKVLSATSDGLSWENVNPFPAPPSEGGPWVLTFSGNAYTWIEAKECEGGN